MQIILLILFLLLCVELGIVLTFEPVSTIAAVSGAVVSVGIAGFSFIHCRIGECCDDRWITANITGKLLLLSYTNCIKKDLRDCSCCFPFGTHVDISGFHRSNDQNTKT